MHAAAQNMRVSTGGREGWRGSDVSGSLARLSEDVSFAGTGTGTMDGYEMGWIGLGWALTGLDLS
jgi:hypothetical protein